MDQGQYKLIDEIGEEYKIEKTENEKYLGDVISCNGKNDNNIQKRKERGIGIISQILSILKEVCFGPFFFKVAVMLRNSLFLSSILLNSEVWYNLTTKNVQELEIVDNMLLRRILECPQGTPTSMMYLDLGCVPIRFLIKSRRIIFLQYILQQNDQSLLFKFFQAQRQNPLKGDCGPLK